MNKNELMDENALLKLQVKELQRQLESAKLPDWMHLIGCWNRQAAEQLRQWAMETDSIITIKQKNEAAHDRQQQCRFDIVSRLIKRPDEIHAICEARQQQRNAALGLAPTEWQFCQMLGLPTTTARSKFETSHPAISVEAQTYTLPVQHHSQSK